MTLNGLIITTVIVGIVFALLWRGGHLLRFSRYVAATREELRKCTWPTRVELKGATVVVLVSIALLGCYTVIVDFVVAGFIRWIMQTG